MNNFLFLDLFIPLFKVGISINDISKHQLERLDKKTCFSNELYSFLDTHNLVIIHTETFFKEAGNKNLIHTDGEGGDYVKLNWVFNNGNAKMCWYKQRDGVNKTAISTSIGTPYIPYRESEVELIESVILNSPSIVQVGIPHNVIDITEDRTCVSLVIGHTGSARVTMQEATDIFRDYIFYK